MRRAGSGWEDGNQILNERWLAQARGANPAIRVELYYCTLIYQVALLKLLGLLSGGWNGRCSCWAIHKHIAAVDLDPVAARLEFAR